ncbi:MAG TPA: hypothetical protein VHP14_24360 [Anaerolineales bacterium]|nr:hypothetical protein [Anaerolineales bacterium]
MKRNVLVISTVLVLLASACTPAGTPTVNPADIAGTAQAAAYTMVALTQQAIPTNTLIPTETASPIPLPTDTPPPLPTQGSMDTALPGVTIPTTLPTFTPQIPSSSGGNNQDPCNQALTKWQGPTATFTIANKTKPKGTIVLGIYVVTEMGQCGNLVITGDSFSGPAGQYSAAAFVNGKKNFKVFGGFKITGGNWKIVVSNDSITAAGSCYPNC